MTVAEDYAPDGFVVATERRVREIGPGRRADMGAASAPFTTASHEIGCVAMRFNS